MDGRQYKILYGCRPLRYGQSYGILRQQAEKFLAAVTKEEGVPADAGISKQGGEANTAGGKGAGHVVLRVRVNRLGPNVRGLHHEPRATGGSPSRLQSPPVYGRLTPYLDLDEKTKRGAQISARPAPGSRFTAVARDGIEPPTRGFSVRCSTN